MNSPKQNETSEENNAGAITHSEGALRRVGWLPPPGDWAVGLAYLDIPVLPFNVIDAVVSTTLGFGLAALLS